MRLPDWAARVIRTFIQGAVGVFVLTWSATIFNLMKDFASIGPGDHLPAVPDLTFWRNLLISLFAGGVIACGSLLWNGVEQWIGKGILKPASPPAPKNVEPVAKV